MAKRMSAKEARNRFAEVLSQVQYGQDTIIIEKQGKPVVAVIDMDRYERLMKAWDEPFRVLDRIAAKNADANPAQVQADVAEVRAAAGTSSRKHA
jgi:prevent-host-death family protein